MKNKDKFKKYLYAGLTLFAALGLTVVLSSVLNWLPKMFDSISTVLSVLRPLVYGAAIAYILYPVCIFFEKLFKKAFQKVKNRKIKNNLIRGFAIFFSIIFGLGVLTVLLYMIIPDLIHNIEKIIYNSPSYIKTIQNFIDNQLASNESLRDYINNIINSYTKDLTSLLNNLGDSLAQVVSSLGTGIWSITIVLKDFFIGIIVAIYLLADRNKFKIAFKRFIELIFNKKMATAVKEEIRYSNEVILNFISGRIVDSVIVGICCYILMIILNIPYALLVSVLVGVTNIIPFFGPFIGGVPSALLILIDNPVKCLVFVIMIVILQQLDGNVICPRIVGNSVGLSSFWVLFSMILFGGLFGITGMIIGVPVFAIIYDIAHKIIIKCEKIKKEKELIKENN